MHPWHRPNSAVCSCPECEDARKEPRDGKGAFLSYLDGNLSASECIDEIASERKCSRDAAKQVFVHWMNNQ